MATKKKLKKKIKALKAEMETMYQIMDTQHEILEAYKAEYPVPPMERDEVGMAAAFAVAMKPTIH